MITDGMESEITVEDLERIGKAGDAKRKERRREVIAIRLPAATVRKARALGKGYTGVLARIIEMGLNDPETVKRAL